MPLFAANKCASLFIPAMSASFADEAVLIKEFLFDQVTLVITSFFLGCFYIFAVQ